MRLIRLYQAKVEGDVVTLDDRNAHHLLKVLRAKPGQPVELFDGEGNWFRGALSAKSTKKLAVIDLDAAGRGDNESPLSLTLLLAVSKASHFDFALQKAVEMGATHIHPVVTEHCEFKLSGERLEKKQMSWLGTVIAACEQSYRCTLPKISTLSSLEDAINACDADVKLVLDHRGAKPIPNALKSQHFSVLVGPEGGLSERDLSLAVDGGFVVTSMGKRVLRTETAPIAALAILGYLYGDLSD
jgi:16S rRNA (uracil1498-N3)-methyltransferase